MVDLSAKEAELGMRGIRNGAKREGFMEATKVYCINLKGDSFVFTVPN